MRNMPRLCATILLLSLSWVSVTLAGQPHDSAWSVGYAQADITPGPKDVQMSGFGRERYAQGVLAPLISQMLVLRDGGGRTGVLITADVLEFERVMVEAIRRATTHKDGIPPENSMHAAIYLVNGTGHHVHHNHIHHCQYQDWATASVTTRRLQESTTIRSTGTAIPSPTPPWTRKKRAGHDVSHAQPSVRGVSGD